MPAPFSAPPTELHHVVPRGNYHGDDVAENLVSLCRVHHNRVEGNIGDARPLLAEAIQQSEPDVYAYAVDKLGEDGWLRLYGVAFSCTVDESAGPADA